MKNAIILHGRPKKAEYYSDKYPSQSNSHWLPWLQKQLLNNDIVAQTPEIPLSYEPLWERWVKEIDRYNITSKTILAGHSCGAGFWVRYLSQHKNLKVGKVMLVAPWIDVEQEDPNRFFGFKIDKNIAARSEKLMIFHSTDDALEIRRSVKKLLKELSDVQYKEFKGRGHFTHRYMPDDTFPELLKELL